MSAKERQPERKPNRLKEYDYSNAGWYYVTICTKGHIRYFGKIVRGEMVKNECGKIVDKYWNWLCAQYKYVELDEYVIMPNHVHGIIIINYANVGTRHALSTTTAPKTQFGKYNRFI